MKSGESSFRTVIPGFLNIIQRSSGIADVEPVSQNSPDSKEMIEKGDACDMHLL